MYHIPMKCVCSNVMYLSQECMLLDNLQYSCKVLSKLEGPLPSDTIQMK